LNTKEPLYGDNIAIVTDSTCDLDMATIREYGIEVLPLLVVYHDREYLDGVDITSEQIYQNLEVEIPKTSLPALADIRSLFTRLRANNVTHILAIHLSGSLSGTHNAVAMVAQEYKDMVIEVIDSKSVSMGVGCAVLEAARECRRSHDFERTVTVAKTVLSKIKVFYVLATIEYLKIGGRIGYVSATVGEFLNIKPIITLNDEGVFITKAKVRGRDSSVRQLVELLKENVRDAYCNVGILHSSAEREAAELVAKARSLPTVKEVFSNQIGPVLGVYAGRGLLGFVVYPVQEQPEL